METTVQGSIATQIAGEEVILLPDRAIFWPSESTLFVADIHLGKDSAFRAGSIPIPGGATKATLDRLCRTVREVDARRIIILGDLWHAQSGRTEENMDLFIEWRQNCFTPNAQRPKPDAPRPTPEVWLVEGNHDLKSGELPKEHNLRIVVPGERLGPFTLLHEPPHPIPSAQRPTPNAQTYGLAAHLHPAARLIGKGDFGVTAPCFWIRPTYAVLPAFGEFTGCSRVRATTNDQVFVTLGDRVREV